jgi:hypothetical protein
VKRYALLFALALAFAIALSAFGRRGTTARHAAAVPRDTAAVALMLVLRDGALSPASATVPKDHLVRLEILNAGDSTTSLRLAGYEDRVALDTLGPGQTRQVEFLADRPGADFTWIVRGNPTGRLVVAGSHLEGDHR